MLTFALTSLSAFAADTAIYRSAESYLRLYDAAPNAKAWIAKAPRLRFAERQVLAQDALADKPLPKMQLEKVGLRTFLRGEDFEIEITDAQRGELGVRGKAVRISKDLSVLEVAYRVQRALGKNARTAWGWRDELRALVSLPSAFAADKEVKASAICVKSSEFLLRTPDALLDSPAGYSPLVWPSAVALALARSGTNLFRNCAAQAREIGNLLQEGRIALKSFDCSEGEADVSMEFWLPEFDEHGANETKEFNLDYLRKVAEEVPEEPETEGLNSKQLQDLPMQERTVYVFSPITSKLTEARILKEENGRRVCKTVHPSDPQAFGNYRDSVERYRKIFEYFGNHDSCMACAPELQLAAVSVRPPKYMPQPLEKVSEEEPAPKKARAKKTKRGGRDTAPERETPEQMRRSSGSAQ